LRLLVCEPPADRLQVVAGVHTLSDERERDRVWWDGAKWTDKVQDEPPRGGSRTEAAFDWWMSFLSPQ
jgi:hypothetical protein